MQISDRLKSERERLGYNQSDFGDIAHATRKTVFNWESGSGSPGADALAVWANVGLDVLYVVTGDRSFVPPPKYSAKEQLLIEYFQQAPEAAQKKMLRMALDDEPAPGANASAAATGNTTQFNTAPGAVQNTGSNNLIFTRKRAPK